MSDLAGFLGAAWRDGLGPDDAGAVAALRASTPADDPSAGELAVFGAWSDLLAGVPTKLPPPTTGPLEIVRAAAGVYMVQVERQPVAVNAAVDALETALHDVRDTAPGAAAARAWSDLALAEVALMVSDRGAAQRRLNAVAENGMPVALRITAMLKLSSVAMMHMDADTARSWARKAAVLAESVSRQAHAERARIVWGMLEYIQGDMAAMRKTLTPQVERGVHGVVARLLLSSIERAGKAMPLLADGLRDATERGDTFAYMLCVMIGARRYVVMKRRADALVTITAGIVQLAVVAKELANVLEHEREQWKTTWPDYADVEAQALRSLDD